MARTFRPRSRLALRQPAQKAKDEAKAKLADGTVKIAVGTHALFSDDVEFQNLGW